MISLLGPETPDPSKIKFRAHHRASFHDVGSSEIAGNTVANLDAMREVLKFVDKRPGEPMLVHCAMGISRSTATALVILLRGALANGTPDAVATCVDAIFQIRPQARPNSFVLFTGLQCFLEKAEAKSVLVQAYRDPRMGIMRDPMILEEE
ncbi:MAG: protein-tyrosine phosphatase family protein [Terrimicrobiaceae bacterium]